MRLTHGSGLVVSVVRTAVGDYLYSRNQAQAHGQPDTYPTLWPRSGKEMKMFAPLRKIARAVRGKTTQEREFDYLNASVSRVDLEFRQREVDRGMFRK